MGIFLCFGDAHLSPACLGDDFSNGFEEIFFLKRDLDTIKGFIVPGHGQVVQIQCLHSILGLVGLGEHFADLPTPICAKVETDDRIPVFDPRQ